MFKNSKIIGCDISYETYSRKEQGCGRGHKDFSMSRGELVEFSTCPNRWLAGFGLSDDSTDSTQWGSMIDCLLTSPARFNELFVVSPETYPDSKTGELKPWTGAANFCKAWKKEQGNKTIIKSGTKLNADKAVTAIENSDIISELFSVSKKQVMVAGFWKDESTGIEIPIRVLIDLVPPKDHANFGKWICDFKTARDGNPAKWARVVDDCAYDIQAALIMDLWISATGEDRTDFVHVVQENVFPFHVTTPPPCMSSEFLDWGRMKYRKALRLYAQCLATGIWPSYEVVGIPFGNTQIISPDGLWNYRQGIGMTEFKLPEEQKEKPTCTLNPDCDDYI